MKILIVSAVIFCLAGTLNAQEQSNSPKAKYKSGSSIVSVWENDKTGKYGDFTELNFKVERLYKKDEEWVSTNYFNLEQLMELRAAIDKAIMEEAVEVKD